MSNPAAPASSVVYPTNPEAYDLKAELGKGAFATVFLAFCRSTQEHVAIKILDLEELDTSWEEIRKEIAVMGLLNHPNVVRCLCSFVVDQEIWLVMPLLAGGSCADTMKRNFPKGFNDEALIATMLRETLQGLAYLHHDGRIHRDVKAGNILISVDGQIQIADFGVAGTLVEAGDRRKSRKTFVGTPCWMAPEVMEQTAGYDQKADIWSFGITALELGFGRPPYAQYQPMKVMIMTLQEEPPTMAVYEDFSKKFSRAYKSMVAACLKKDPTKRPTADALLKHKFFKLAKKSQYVIDSLLSQIPRPKWNTDALIARSRHASVSGSSATDPAVPAAAKHVATSWVFDDNQIKEYKESESAPAATRSSNPFDEIEMDVTASNPVARAPEESSTQVGRFTIRVTNSTAEPPPQLPTVLSAPQIAPAPTVTSRFIVSDMPAPVPSSTAPGPSPPSGERKSF